MARPPLLCQGGEFHSDASRHFRFIVFSPTRLFCLPRSGGLNVTRVVDTGASSIRRACTDEACRKLIHIRLADQNGAGIEKPLNDGGGAFGNVRKRWAACRCLHSGNIEVIFYGKGHTPERPRTI